MGGLFPWSGRRAIFEGFVNGDGPDVPSTPLVAAKSALLLNQLSTQGRCRGIRRSRYHLTKIAAEGGDFMPTIRVKENEPFDVALRRFKRTIEKTGIITELRAREFYEKPTSERKRKKAAAVKRHFKRLRSQMLPKKMY